MRGRVGFEAGRFLPYVTGGFAWGGLSGGIDGVVGLDDTQTGWTIGGGIEASLGSNWSLKAEYLHIDLGEEDYVATVGTTTYAASSDLTIDTVRLGLNYRFGERERAPAPLK